MRPSLHTPGLVAVIPARGGSKRIPRKNARCIAGRPMISWVIDAAVTSGVFDRVIVSTDDEEIAEISRLAGAWVPSLRPAELALDSTPTIDVVIHELAQFPELATGVLIQPTSPLVLPQDILGVLELLETRKADSVVSVCPSEATPATLFERDDQRGVLAQVSEPHEAQPEARMSAWVQLNGAIYAFRTPWIYTTRAFIDSTTLGYVMPPERSVDVDIEMDWILAEQLLEARRSSL